MNELCASSIAVAFAVFGGCVEHASSTDSMPRKRVKEARVFVERLAEAAAPSWCWSTPVGLADYQQARAWYLGTQFVRALFHELEGGQPKALLGQTFGIVDAPLRNGAPLFIVYPFAIRVNFSAPGVQLVQNFASVADDIFDQNHKAYVLSLLPIGLVEGLVNEERAFGIRIDYRIRLLNPDPNVRSRFGVNGTLCVLPRSNDSIVVYDRVRSES